MIYGRFPMQQIYTIPVREAFEDAGYCFEYYAQFGTFLPHSTLSNWRNSESLLFDFSPL